jgi:hypothetical protein
LFGNAYGVELCIESSNPMAVLSKLTGLTTVVTYGTERVWSLIFFICFIFYSSYSCKTYGSFTPALIRYNLFSELLISFIKATLNGYFGP